MDDILGAPVGAFIGLTVVLVGGAAILPAGPSAATGSRPGRSWPRGFGLALADRFLVYALFEGELLSVWGRVAASAC